MLVFSPLYSQNIPQGLSQNQPELEICNRTPPPDNHALVIAEIEQSLLEESDNPYLHYNLGIAHIQQQNWQEAKASLIQALQFNADQTLLGKIYYNLGNVNACEQKFKDAITQYREALQTTPQDQESRYNLALAYQLLKQQQQEQQEQQEQQQNSEENGESSTNPERTENQDGSSSEENRNQAQEENSEQEQEPSSMNEAQEENSEQEQEPSSMNEGQQNTKENQEAEEETGTAANTIDSEEEVPQISEQQAEQLLNTVPENQRNFIQRLLQREGVPTNRPPENW